MNAVTASGTLSRQTGEREVAVYTADAVAMNRRLVGQEPDPVREIFDRAAAGLDRIETTPTQIGEVAATFSGDGQIAGVELQLSPRAAVRQLLDGSVTVPRLGRGVLVRLGRPLELYSLHDAILIAAHRSRGTDEVVTNDAEIETFDTDEVVWD